MARTTPRIALPAVVLLGAVALGTAMVTAAPPDAGPSARPERPEGPTKPERPAPNPIAPVPARPANPSTPVNPITAPAGGGQAGGAGTGSGTATPPAALAPVPRGIKTAGLTAGTGEVQVRYFTDLGDVGSASGHLAVIPALMARLASDGLGTIVMRPLVVTGDPNSTEAACAVIAAIGTNRAWHVAHHLSAARVIRDGNWITPAVLGAVARKIAGLQPTRFIRASASRSCFPQLNRFRREAATAKVGTSPTYVITGAGGTTKLAAPASAQQVIDAIRGAGT